MIVQLFLTSTLLSCTNTPLQPNAYVIENLNQTIGGPKALAREGDIILENEYLRTAIIGKRHSMGPHTEGGGIIDADIQRRSPKYANGHGNDQIGEIFSTINMNVAQIDQSTGTVKILHDGSDGEAAVVCAVGDAKPFISLLDALWAVLQWKQDGAMPFDIRTDYILEPNSPVVKIKTTALFGENAGCDEDISNAFVVSNADIGTSDTDPSLIQVALDAGVAFGDFYLQGGSLNVFTPGVGYDETGFVYGLNQAGINTFSSPILADFIAGTGNKVSYAIMNPQGPMYIPLFTSSQTVGFSAVFVALDKNNDDIPEEYACYNKRCFPSQIQYERWFTVGEGDVGSALDHFLQAKGASVGRIDGFVREEETGIAVSGAHVFVFPCDDAGVCADVPYSEWLSDVGDDVELDGSFGGTLPVGSYELLVHKQGHPDSSRIPVQVTANSTQTLVLGSPAPSTVSFTVQNEMLRNIPAKISVFTVNDEDVLNPNLGDSFIGGHPAAVVFAAYGQGTITLPPGEYYAIASRGPEYEIDISETFIIDDKNHIDLEFFLARTVDTSGWISADFHVHSVPSFDSGATFPLRVSTMVSEGVEYFTGTDHDYISDFDPTIEKMGLTEWVNSAPGLEITTIEVGHYLGFPVKIDRLADAGGSVDWTGLRPQEMIDDLLALVGPTETEPVIFIGHPRDGILGYFDQFNLDPYNDNDGAYSLASSITSTLLSQANPVLAHENFSTDVDGLELLNGKRLELIRTPTQPELDAYANGEELSPYAMNSRTMEEQQDLIDGTFRLGYGHEGQVDDWFTLLNLGYRYTAMGNSDTHKTTDIESGCPRNYVYIGDDEPLYADDVAIAEAVKEHRVVASYGPFVEFYAYGDKSLGVGSEIAQQGSAVQFHIEVQSPSWFDVDRVELYENGTLIQEFAIEVPNTDTVNFSQDIEITPSKDSWYVVIALGNSNMAPLYTAVEIPPVQLQDVVLQAFADVDLSFDVSNLLSPLVPIPRNFEVIPFALTNPIWIDQNGDGTFTAPGLPSWLEKPEEQ